MKVKQLIEELQKADPSGELQVDGVTYIEKLPGYWDGPCSYIDEQGNFVIDSKKEKVRIKDIDLESFLWDNDGDTSKLILDDVYPMYKERLDIRIKTIQEQIRAYFTEEKVNDTI
jgi:hypothetical protein